MSEEFPHTPLPAGTGNVLEHRVNSIELKYTDIKKMVISNRESMIEIVGSSGKNGRIGFIKSQLEEISTEIQEIHKIMENQRIFIWKICLAMLATSGAGAGLAQVILAAVG
jgi:hypothetical protein